MSRAAVVVGDDLDDGDVGLLVVVGEGAGLALTEGDGNIAVYIAVTSEAVEGIAGQQGLVGGVGAGIDRDSHAT